MRSIEGGNVPELDIELAFLGRKPYHCTKKGNSSVHGTRLLCILGVVEQSLKAAVDSYGACEEDGDDVRHLYLRDLVEIHTRKKKLRVGFWTRA